MVLRTVNVNSGQEVEFQMPLVDNIRWNIRVRDGYDIALRVRFLPNKEGRTSGSSSRRPTAMLSDGRQIKLRDQGPRVFAEYDRSDSFQGQIVLSELDDDFFIKGEWDLSFILDNVFSYFKSKTIDLEIVTDGVPMRSTQLGGYRVSPTAGTNKDRLSIIRSNSSTTDALQKEAVLSAQREDRTVEKVFSDSGAGPSKDIKMTDNANVDNSSKHSSLFADDDPDMARCLEAKAQVDFVWMRCMLKESLRRCPPDAIDLRAIFGEAQNVVEGYIDNQFLDDEKEDS